MNNELFNYIFDIKEIGLNIIKYLPLKDCMDTFNLLTKSTNELLKYKLKDIFFLVYECNKQRIIYILDIHFKNHLAVPACKHSKMYGNIHIINQNKKINLNCEIYKYNYLNDDFIYKNNSEKIQLNRIYNNIIKNRCNYKKLFYKGSYKLHNIKHNKLKNVEIHFLTSHKYKKNILIE